MRDLLTNKSLYWRFILPCFIFDARRWLRTSTGGSAEMAARWAAFFLVFLCTVYAGVLLLIYRPAIIPGFRYSISPVNPIIWSKHANRVKMWYTIQYVLGVNVLNFASLRLLPHSPLAHRVAASILAEKTLPNGWHRIEQTDTQTVDVYIPATLARFRACEDELQAVGGLDIMCISEIKHGHIQITCRLAQPLKHENPYHMRGQSIVFDEPRTVYWYVLHDGNGMVKVGHSYDPRKYRKPVLSAGNPNLDFYRRPDGSEFMFPQTEHFNESKFKKQFAHLRTEKECFTLAPEMKRFLDTFEMN